MTGAAHSPLALLSFACAAIAAAILIGFLVKRPMLTTMTRVMLLLGLGAFPIGSAATANVQGYEATTAREFCGSCHVMTPYASDSKDKNSRGLASRHSRNPWFGDRSCYTCHADYGMFGTVLTKMGGMRHVWLYYTEFRDMPLEESKQKIHIRKPYPNENCMQCHSTDLQGWLKTPDHRASLEDVRKGSVSCASAGCHGYAHPFTKKDGAQMPAQLSAPDAGAPR
jgi:nitrate/TMAO reductase-like tetraheme cytochrome c subunit